MKNFEERSYALTGSACLKKAVDDQHQDNSTSWETRRNANEHGIFVLFAVARGGVQ
ncbi:MAG: hypothetical protein ACOH2P_06610 [Pseudomonas sp.]